MKNDCGLDTIAQFAAAAREAGLEIYGEIIADGKDDLEFECLNDSKGLNNGRIEQLIKEYKQLWENLNT